MKTFYDRQKMTDPGKIGQGINGVRIILSF